MGQPKFCIYLRVSTKKQGESGLGLAAQRKMCEDYISSKGGSLIKEFQDVESGTHRDRPGLWAAIEFSKANSTEAEPCTLVIAKLDRLARDVEFVFKIVNSGVQIAFVDMPIVNTVTLGIFATVAQYERELISSRTKSSLGAIKDEIAKNGGHVSKAGRYIKRLGGPTAPREAHLAAAASHTKRADTWRNSSPLYGGVMADLDSGMEPKKIVEKYSKLYDKNPTVWCTRKGAKLCAGTVSRWAKER